MADRVIPAKLHDQIVQAAYMARGFSQEEAPVLLLM